MTDYVYLKSDHGFGYFLRQLESAFIFCKTHEAKLVVDLRNSTYLDDQSINAFETFFKPIRTRSPEIITDTVAIDNLLEKYSLKVPSNFLSAEDGLWAGDKKGLEKALVQVAKGNGLSKKIAPSGIVLNNLNKYKDLFFQPDKYIVGLHVRFGNKEKGWSKLPERFTKRDKHIIFNKLDAYLSGLTKLQRRVGIFVCSDTASFVKEIKSRYDNVICIDRFFLDDGAGAFISDKCLNPTRKSKSIEKIHKYGRINIGTEALTELFLLKECDILIRTPSSFSDLAKNSGVPCIEVAKS